MTLVRGQGLAKLIAHTETDQNLISYAYTTEGIISDIWYQDIFYFLLQGKCHIGTNGSQQRALKTKCTSYMIKGGHLYQKNYEGIYLKCLNCEEAKDVLHQFHDRYDTGHGSAKSTTHLILRSGYYWPTLFKDTQQHVRTCFICQTSAHRERNPTMPL